jgi:hypothetical protein
VVARQIPVAAERHEAVPCQQVEVASLVVRAGMPVVTPDRLGSAWVMSLGQAAGSAGMTANRGHHLAENSGRGPRAIGHGRRADHATDRMVASAFSACQTLATRSAECDACHAGEEAAVGRLVATLEGRTEVVMVAAACNHHRALEEVDQTVDGPSAGQAVE